MSRSRMFYICSVLFTLYFTHVQLTTVRITAPWEGQIHLKPPRFAWIPFNLASQLFLFILLVPHNYDTHWKRYATYIVFSTSCLHYETNLPYIWFNCSAVNALRAIKNSLDDPLGFLDGWNRGDPCVGNWTRVICENETATDGYLHVKELYVHKWSPC
jgi:hypothetical protein